MKRRAAVLRRGLPTPRFLRQTAFPVLVNTVAESTKPRRLGLDPLILSSGVVTLVVAGCITEVPRLMCGIAPRLLPAERGTELVDESVIVGIYR